MHGNRVMLPFGDAADVHDDADHRAGALAAIRLSHRKPRGRTNRHVIVVCPGRRDDGFDELVLRRVGRPRRHRHVAPIVGYRRWRALSGAAENEGDLVVLEDAGEAAADDADEHDAGHTAHNAKRAELALAPVAGGGDVDRPANAQEALFLVAGGHPRHRRHAGRALAHRQQLVAGRHEGALQVHLFVLGGTARDAATGATALILPLVLGLTLPAVVGTPAGARASPPPHAGSSAAPVRARAAATAICWPLPAARLVLPLAN